MNVKKRSYKKELLDGDDIPFQDIQRNMQELDVINTYLGGHAITLAGIKALLGGRKQIHICEIGCGGGDNLSAILKWCKRRQVTVNFTGIDIKQACIGFAATRSELADCTQWVTSDYAQAVFVQKPDIVFSSLFCHHFTEAQLISQLAWMKQNSNIGFFINDLHRHPLAYASIKMLTALFSKSYLVKNDAPLSVARGFTQKEWQQLLLGAGLEQATIYWKWAFRHLITYKHGV